MMADDSTTSQEAPSSSDCGKVENAWSMKIPEFRPEDNPHGLLEESSFATLFPKYREAYLQEVWPLVSKCLEPHHITATLDVIEGSMVVATTRRTWDPYMIIKARDMLRLLARSVPLEQARRVLEDSVAADIIRLKTLVRNRERFVKRRQRLIGADGSTLKAIELLSGCYVQVQGNTVAALGPYLGLQHVRKIVEDTMRNVHPIYNIKTLMIKRELARNPAMRHEDWSRFLPQFKKKNTSRRRQPLKTGKSERARSLFPPQVTESKVDKEIAAGVYFMSERRRKSVQQREMKQQRAVQAAVREQRREKIFRPPRESGGKRTAATTEKPVDIGALNKKMKRNRLAANN